MHEKVTKIRTKGVDNQYYGIYRMYIQCIYRANHVNTKKDKQKKKKSKDSQLLIRVNSEERDRFLEICQELDTSAAREIRRFMREYIKKYEDQE